MRSADLVEPRRADVELALPAVEHLADRRAGAWDETSHGEQRGSGEQEGSGDIEARRVVRRAARAEIVGRPRMGAPEPHES